MLTTLIFSLFPVATAVEESDWYNLDFSHRNIYSINATLIDEVLTDFPVLVYFNNETVDFSYLDRDLDDLRFVDANNDLMDHEIDDHDYYGNEDAWLWVRLPTVSNITDTIFYMYYGNEDAESVEDEENVWDEDFVMVQHMNNYADPSYIEDSTVYDHFGTKKALDEPNATLAQIANGQDFDGTDDYIRTSDTLDFTTEITISLWAKAEAIAGYMSLFCYRWNSGNPRAWLFLTDPTDRWTFQVTTADGSSVATGVIGDTDFHYFVGKWKSGEAASLTLDDNAPVTGAVLTSTLTTPTIIALGNMEIVNQNRWDGVIDEVQLSNVKRSSAWDKASYECQTLNLIDFLGGEIITDEITLRSLVFMALALAVTAISLVIVSWKRPK